jgi:Holliday junction resolvase RusA-like endonuclease
MEAFARIYEAATGNAVSHPISTDNRKSLHTWFRENFELLWFNSVRQTSGRTAIVHADIASKASWIVQMACPTCGRAERTFPIGVEPWSAQSSERKVEIRNAVTAGLRGMPGSNKPLEGPLCLSVVSVVPRSYGNAKKKDVDNLVKGLLDALSGYLYVDDSAIQCLTTRRLEFAGSKGYYMVGVRRARPFEEDVIFDDPSPVRLVWGDLRQV